MFSTLPQKLLVGVYIFILLSIPIGTYLVSQSQNTRSSASDQQLNKKTTITTPKPTTVPARKIFDLSQATSNSNTAEATPTPEPSESSSSTPTIATSFGPTLSLKVILEGRPTDNQATKLFVGIAEGALTNNPKFILSFSVDLSATGSYTNLSLAGLNPGSTYTALLKGAAQIATSVSFTMSPTVSNLGSGDPLTLISGDLNEDNVINSADYSIAQKSLGTTSRSSNWNENADINKDGLINVFDLAVIAKNMGKIGSSGAWTSPIPKVATPSGGLTQPSAGGPENGSGYWIWVPK